MKYWKKSIICAGLTILLVAGAQPALASGDTQAPRLNSVAVTDECRDGNDLKYYVEVQAADNLSGVHHITVEYKNLDNDRTATVVLRSEDGRDGVYGGWLKINAFEPEGTFTLYKVTLTDNEENYQVYCRYSDIDSDSDADEDKLALPNIAPITVNTGITTPDKNAPVLESITAAPDAATAESELTILAKVTDDGGSGIDYVKVRFVNQCGHGITVSLDLHEGTEGCYAGTVSEIQTKLAGTYVLDRVMVKDNAGNRAVYLPGSGVLEQVLQFVIGEKNA